MLRDESFAQERFEARCPQRGFRGGIGFVQPGFEDCQCFVDSGWGLVGGLCFLD
jgi:hypothetical protein